MWVCVGERGWAPRLGLSCLFIKWRAQFRQLLAADLGDRRVMASLGHSVIQPSSLHGQEISQHWLLRHLLPGEEGRAGANKVSSAAAIQSSFPGLRLRKYQVHPWRVTCHGRWWNPCLVPRGPLVDSCRRLGPLGLLVTRG